MITEINNYISILNELPNMLNDSPLKMGHIVKTVGMNNPTFYRKLKNKTFTADEVLRIAKILRPEEAYKAELLESIKNADEDIKAGRVVSHEEAMKGFREYLTK